MPFNVPSFGDAGQIYDPFVYLGLLAGQTKRIALGVASIVLPLRHPAHVAKAAGKLPMLITGGSQQDPDWVAENGDGWMIYPRDPLIQSQIIDDWQARVEAAGRPAQPVMQPLYIDLVDDPGMRPQPIHLGFRLGVRHLRAYLKSLQEIGINHVALNLRFNQADIETTLKHLANEILQDFSGPGITE